MDLPQEILLMVFDKLSTMQCVRIAVVCQNWYYSIVRVIRTRILAINPNISRFRINHNTTNLPGTLKIFKCEVLAMFNVTRYCDLHNVPNTQLLYIYMNWGGIPPTIPMHSIINMLCSIAMGFGITAIADVRHEAVNIVMDIEDIISVSFNCSIRQRCKRPIEYYITIWIDGHAGAKRLATWWNKKFGRKSGPTLVPFYKTLILLQMMRYDYHRLLNPFTPNKRLRTKRLLTAIDKIARKKPNIAYY